MADIVSDLMYAEKPLSEIAGYDTRQLIWVVCRSRDEYGKLKSRSGLPSWVEVDAMGNRIVTNPQPMHQIIWQMGLDRGMEEEEVRKELDIWFERNPKARQYDWVE